MILLLKITRYYKWNVSAAGEVVVIDGNRVENLN